MDTNALSVEERISRLIARALELNRGVEPTPITTGVRRTKDEETRLLEIKKILDLSSYGDCLKALCEYTPEQLTDYSTALQSYSGMADESADLLMDTSFDDATARQEKVILDALRNHPHYTLEQKL